LFVIVATTCEILFNVIPQVIQMGIVVLNVKSNVGPFISALAGVDSLITAIIYRRLIMRRIEKNVTVVQNLVATAS
jgi:hypothetical protein